VWLNISESQSKLDLSPFPAPLTNVQFLTCHDGEGLMCQQLAVQCASNSITVLCCSKSDEHCGPTQEKEHAILIDHTENWKHHGLPDEDEHGAGFTKTISSVLNALISSSLSPRVEALPLPSLTLPGESSNLSTNYPSCQSSMELERYGGTVRLSS